MQETIRNFFFHVPMWFGMMILLLVSVVYAIKYLKNPTIQNDAYSVAFANTGIIFGVLGLITGAFWANYQWGSPWSGDPKQNGAAIAILIYLAYFVLRGSMNDEEKKSKNRSCLQYFCIFHVVSNFMDLASINRIFTSWWPRE